MKNHIVFKFIAILLCAAALLGAVAGGGGILVMMEAQLYEKTAEQAYRDTIESYAHSYGSGMAVRFASAELGGANSQLVNDYYGYGWCEDVFAWDKIGYVITDENGEMLLDQSLADGQEVEYALNIPASGRYMLVHDILTEEEYQGSQVLPEGISTDNALGHVYNAIPEGGAEIYLVEMRFHDGTAESIGAYEESLGSIYSTPEGAAEFISYEGVNLLEDNIHPIHTYLAFYTRDGQLVYEIQSEDGVVEEGRYQQETTYLLLRNFTAEVYVHDAIPPGGCAVTSMYVEYADGFAESVGGTPEIGIVCYDEEGNVCFAPHDNGALDYNNNRVTMIRFHDGDALIYEARDPDGVGYFFHMGGGYMFRGSMDVTPEETEPSPQPDDSGQIIGDTVPVVPSDGAKVYRAEIWSPSVDTVIKVESDSGALGEVFVNGDGFVVFRCQGIFDSGFETNFIRLLGENGELLFEAYDRSVEAGKGASVGKFTYDDGGSLIFTTDLNYGIALMGEDLLLEDPAETFMAEIQKNVETLDTPNGEANGRTFSKGDIINVIETETADGVQWARTAQGWINMENLIRVEMPVVEFEIETVEETVVPTEESLPQATVAADILQEETQNTEPVYTDPTAYTLDADTEVYCYYDSTTGQQMYALYTWEPLPVTFVEVQLAEGAFQYEHDWVLIRLLYALKNQLPILLAVSLLLFAIFLVYLCCAAGKRPGSQEVRAGGLNAMPLELHGVIAVSGVVCFVLLGYQGSLYLLKNDILIGILCAAFCGYGASLLIVAFLFACAAQFKTPGGYWWRKSLTGRCLSLVPRCGRRLLKFAEWTAGICERKLWPGLMKLCRNIFRLCRGILKLLGQWVEKFLGWSQKCGEKLWAKLTRFISLLPLTWQWLLTGFLILLLIAITFKGRYDMGMIVSVLFGAAMVLYGSHCFGTLLESTKKMSKGDLEEKVDDKLMVGSFKDFAGELNGLADVAVVAAQKQLKSERMKTELITNVSHDIKTPLTSIINYVDLLQKPHTDEEQEKYLEVLDRQSLRLKKLIDDLMEMSKASTGNMSVDITRLDAAEAVNQALGEFADKLEKARLYPVFRQPEKPVYMLADGRLVWRVMSNLLSNAVKYALPGTRLYLDLQKVDSKVIISLKNISREELNVEADELLERFVRGDASRNTEGSGLGLNIAQSLMELQKGQLQILVDGDLFKVTLIFPAE